MSCATIEQHISRYNLREIIGPEVEGVMVYGIVGCFYEHVCSAAEKHILIDGTETSTLKPLKKVYDHCVGDKFSKCRGLDDRTPLPKIKFTRNFRQKEISRQCKAGVTNITIYNTIQEEQGKGIVPIIFCVKGKKFDSSKACDWEVNKKTALSKDSTFNEKITIKEVRRIGKLCFDEEIDPRVRRTAQKNVFFVEVTEHRDIDKGTNTHHYTYTLTKIPPPWGTTQKSIAAFKQGLKQRAAEKETNPFDRAMRRISDLGSFTTSTILSQERMILIKLIAQTKTEELTVAENEDFESAFDWDTVLESDRTFTCFGGGVPKTLKQAYAERIEAHIETPSFREQVNTRLFKTLLTNLSRRHRSCVLPSTCIHIVTRKLVFGFATIPVFEPDSIAPVPTQALASSPANAWLKFRAVAVPKFQFLNHDEYICVHSSCIYTNELKSWFFTRGLFICQYRR